MVLFSVGSCYVSSTIRDVVTFPCKPKWNSKVPSIKQPILLKVQACKMHMESRTNQIEFSMDFQMNK